MQLYPRNVVMCSDNPDNRKIPKSDNDNEHETNFSKTDNNYWPPSTVNIVGD